MLARVLANGIINGCGYVLIALGMSMVFGILNIINIAHSMFYTIGCYTFYTTATIMGLSFVPSVLLAICVLVLFSLVVEKAIFAPLSTKGHIMQIIAANGLAILLMDAIRILWTADSIRLKTPYLNIRCQIGSVVFNKQRLLIVIFAIVAVIFVNIIINKTRFGLMMRALPQDNIAAKLNGINANLVSSATFMLGSAIAVMGSVTMGPTYTLVPNIGDSLGNKIMAAIIFGGIGSIPGTVIGALFIGIVEALVAGYIASGYENLIVFCILIFTLIIKPTGLMGKKQL